MANISVKNERLFIDGIEHYYKPSKSGGLSVIQTGSGVLINGEKPEPISQILVDAERYGTLGIRIVGAIIILLVIGGFLMWLFS
jgi:hypothetical protein